jgi:hypothetical protein
VPVPSACLPCAVLCCGGICGTAPRAGAGTGRLCWCTPLLTVTRARRLLLLYLPPGRMPPWPLLPALVPAAPAVGSEEVASWAVAEGGMTLPVLRLLPPDAGVSWVCVRGLGEVLKRKGVRSVAQQQQQQAAMGADSVGGPGAKTSLIHPGMRAPCAVLDCACAHHVLQCMAHTRMCCAALCMRAQCAALRMHACAVLDCACAHHVLQCMAHARMRCAALCMRAQCAALRMHNVLHCACMRTPKAELHCAPCAWLTWTVAGRRRHTSRQQHQVGRGRDVQGRGRRNHSRSLVCRGRGRSRRGKGRRCRGGRGVLLLHRGPVSAEALDRRGFSTGGGVARLDGCRAHKVGGVASTTRCRRRQAVGARAAAAAAAGVLSGV